MIPTCAERLASRWLKTGYWTWKDGTGLSMVVFDSEEHAKTMAERVPSMISDAITLEGVEMRGVVADA